MNPNLKKSLIIFFQVCNNSIYHSIKLFLKNLDLLFSGKEPCPICYCILHYQNKSLPTKKCHTCNYYFHTLCIRKWVETSSNNTCPTCRSPLNIGVNICLIIRIKTNRYIIVLFYIIIYAMANLASNLLPYQFT